MRELFSIITLCLALTACADSEDDAGSTSPPLSAETSEPEVATPSEPSESDACRVAATTWADRMSLHLGDATISIVVSASPFDMSDVEDPTSQIKAGCSGSLSDRVLEGNYEAALLNAKILGCGSMCKGTAKREASEVRDRLEAQIDKVRAQLG